jgi:hypothetical protein
MLSGKAMYRQIKHVVNFKIPIQHARAGRSMLAALAAIFEGTSFPIAWESGTCVVITAVHRGADLCIEIPFIPLSLSIFSTHFLIKLREKLAIENILCLSIASFSLVC